jgi:hypothetical protein
MPEARAPHTPVQSWHHEALWIRKAATGRRKLRHAHVAKVVCHSSQLRVMLLLVELHLLHLLCLVGRVLCRGQRR